MGKCETCGGYCCDNYTQCTACYRKAHPNGLQTWIDGNGYPMLFMPMHPKSNLNGNIHEHIVIAEEKIGRPLQHGEIVHHINHIKTNNDPNNLQVMSEHEHRALHYHENHPPHPMF